MKHSYKSLLSVFFTLIIPMSLWGQEDAREIFTRASDQMLTQNMEIVMEMNITDKKGRTKEKGYEILIASLGEIEKTNMSVMGAKPSPPNRWRHRWIL